MEGMQSQSNNDEISHLMVPWHKNCSNENESLAIQPTVYIVINYIRNSVGTIL